MVSTIRVNPGNGQQPPKKNTTMDSLAGFQLRERNGFQRIRRSKLNFLLSSFQGSVLWEWTIDHN